MRLINAEPYDDTGHVTFEYPSRGGEALTGFIMMREIHTIDAAPVVHGRWIPVTERLPETFVPVIVSHKGGKVEQGNYDLNGWWRVYGTRTKKVTHWMPLPEPPEIEETED